MTRRSRLLGISAAAAAALYGFAYHASARDLVWDSDADSSNGATDGAGSWNTTVSNWFDGTNDVTWSNSPADNATYGTTTTTNFNATPINIDFSEPITVSNLTLAQDATGAIYNFSDFGGGPLTIQGNVNKTALTGFVNWLVPNSGIALDTGDHTFALHDSPGDTLPELTINGPLSGPGNLILDNGSQGYDTWGSMAINVDNSFAGAITVNKGRLIITKPTSLGISGGTSGTVINNQGTLSVGGGGTGNVPSMTVNENVTINRDTYTGTDFTQYPYALIKNNGSNDVTWAGTVTLNSTDARIASSTGTLTLTNIVAGVPGAVLGLTGDFAGYVLLPGDNTAALSAGGIKLVNGVELQAFSQAEIGGPNSPLQFVGDATLGIMNGFMTDFGTHPINQTSFGGGLDIPTGNTFNVNIPLSGGAGLGKRGGGTLNFNASVSGTGNIFFDAGTVNIAAPVTYGSLHLRSPVVNIGTGGSMTTTGGFSSFGQDSTGTAGGPDKAVINITGNGILAFNTANNVDFNLSDNANTEGTINLHDQGQLTVAGLMHVGKNAGGKGLINQDGGTFTLTRNGNFTLVLGSRNGSGTYNISSTAVMTNAGEFYVGQGTPTTSGVGTFTMTGGTVNQNNWFVVGRERGYGTVDISGGTFNKAVGGNTSIGDSAGPVPSSMTLRGTANYNSTVGEFWVANGGSGVTATLTVKDNAILSVSNWLAMGRGGGFATVDISDNATVTKSGGNNSYVGESNTVVTSTMTVRGNGKFTASTGEFWVGQGGGSGILTVQDNAVFTVNNWLALGRANGNSKGIINFTGGTMTKTSVGGGFLAIGSGGSGTFNQTGGTLNVDGTRLAENSAGTLNISGGTSNFSGEFSLGFKDSAVGTMNVSGTANVTLPSVVIGVNATLATNGGVLNLNGGTLTAGNFTAGASATALRNLVFNGGLLKPAADSTNFIGAKVTSVVSTGGARIDSNGKNVIVNSPMIHDPALGGADGGLIKSGTGSVTLAGNITYNGPTSVTNGKLSLATNLTSSPSVSLSNDAVVEIAPNGSSTRIVKTGGISLTGTSKINVQDNKLITTTPVGSWTGSNYTGVTGLVASGKGTGNLWDGSTGIITSQSAAVGSNFTSVGVARASDVRPATATATGLWGGQTITGTDTLVMYTYGGDANLDGKINVDDYIKIDSGIAAGLTGWSNGDFNYDGKVNIDDYTTVIDANIGNQTVVFPTAGGIDAGGGAGVSGVSGVSAVPEPAGLSIVALSAVSLLGGRRRRKDRKDRVVV